MFIGVFTCVQLVDSKIDQIDEIGELRLEEIKSEFEAKLISSENSLAKFATESQRMLTSNMSLRDLEAYIVTQKDDQYMRTEGECFNVYAANDKWTIIPDFDMPSDYHATERLWYLGAIDSAGEIYVTEPYIDSMTGKMCFTASKMLDDRKTVVAMDFTLSEVQKSIIKMMGGNDYKAIIVTRDGMVVGFTDMSVVGTKAKISLPEYSDVLTQVIASKEHDRFQAVINDNKVTVFSSETHNGWYMILCINDDVLYRDTYRDLAFIALIYFLLLTVTLIIYINAVKNRIRAEKALDAKNEFLSGISEELRNPLNKIIKLSDSDRIDNSIDIKDDFASIRESGLQLSQKMDNLFSYAYMVSEEKYDKSSKKKGRDISKTIRKSRTFIVILFVLAMLSNLAVSTAMGYVCGASNMRLQLDEYYVDLNTWTNNQSGLLDMFANCIEADPSILDDYDSCVKWLNDIASNYPDISVCYMTNPHKEHTVIMNNGWQPDSDWHVEDRQWYKDTVKSESGFNISAPYRDEQTNSYCITFSKVVYGKNNEFLGVFGIDFFMDQLIGIFGDDSSADSYAFLADSDGNILNHPNQAYEMTADKSVNIADTNYRKIQALVADPGFRDYNGKLSTAIKSTAQNTGFTLYIVCDWWSVYGTFVIVTIVNAFILIICILIVLVMINRIINWQNDVNDKLMESVSRADAAGKAKSQFLAQMSHEIRTPINAVIGMDEMILRESNDPKIQEYATNINTAGKTLLELVNGILDFSKLEEGKMEIVPVKYKIVPLIEEMYNLIIDKAEKKGLSLEFDVDPNLPTSLFGDDVRIKQVISNILTNAVKYTHEGSVKMTVTGSYKNEEEYILHISVKDTGIGIREEDMDKLFQSFQRLDVEKNRNIEGTGLGISIIHGLLTRMGSELKVTSIYGEGSEFSFDLDQKIIDKTPVGKFDRSGIVIEESKQVTLNASNAEVLVVDDNDMNLKVAKGLLSLFGIIPDLAASGKECISMAQVKRYDIIFLDHMMPGMDGITTLKNLVKEELVFDTPVICLTANAVAGTREKYIQEGFNEYLAKPIEVKELEIILERFLPPDKITHIENDDEEADNKSRISDPIGYLKKQGFDTAAGIMYTAGSEEFYLEMVGTFAEGYDSKSAEIIHDFESGDLDDYRTRVHALKSTAKMIGARELAECALSMEMAAKDNNSEAVKAGNGHLLDLYKQTVESIRNALSED